jgi:hypothetical protein
MSANIKEVYEKHKNLKLAANELGMKWQTLYVQLRNIGVPVTGDKSRYGSDKDRMAAMAELEFRRLVPFAVCQNDIKFQSKFDFLVSGEKIDVKASKLNRGCVRFPALRWAFSVKKQEFCADFIVCFAMLDEGYRILLIPGELVRKYSSISISQNGRSKWLQYEVEPHELAEFFSELSKAA